MVEKTQNTAVEALAENALKTRFKDLDQGNCRNDKGQDYRHHRLRYWRRQRFR